MSVEGNHLQLIAVNFKQFAGHQTVVIVVSDRENRLADNFFQCELRNNNAVAALYFRQVSEIIAALSGNVEFCFFTSYQSLIAIVR